MAGFQRDFAGTAPPQEAIEPAPNAALAGAATLFDLLASSSKSSSSSADERAARQIEGRKALWERADEIGQLKAGGANVGEPVNNAVMAALDSGISPDSIGKIFKQNGIEIGEVTNVVGPGSPHDYNNQEPPAEELAAHFGAVKAQNPGMSDDEVFVKAREAWVNNKLYEDDDRWATLSSGQAWAATVDYAYGNANMAFWQLMAGDLNDNGQDNQIGPETLAQMKNLLNSTKSAMIVRWENRNEAEGRSGNRTQQIENLFGQFEEALKIAEDGMLLAPEDGKPGPSYRIATWLMTQSGEEIAEVINSYHNSTGEQGDIVDADALTPLVKKRISNWMTALTLGSGKDVSQEDNLIIANELKGNKDLKNLLVGKDLDVAATLDYIYNAVITEGTPAYLKDKRKQISALSESMGWSLTSTNGVDPSPLGSDGAATGGAGAATGGAGAATGGAGAATGGAGAATGKVAPVSAAKLFRSPDGPPTTPVANNQAAEKKAILGVKRFYDNVQILGGVTTKGANGPAQIVAWQDYDNSTPEAQELMKAQVDAAGQQLTHVLKTVISMSVNGMDGQLQEQVMGSERMVNIIRAMNTSGVPGARDTALALTLLQGEAADKIVALNGKYFESIARTLEDTSYGRIIKPTEHGGPVEINIEAFTNNSLLDDVDIGWDYDLDATTPGHLRNLIGAIRDTDESFGEKSDSELLKILAAQGVSVGSNSANLKLINDGLGVPQWNAHNTIVGNIGVVKVEGGEDTVAGLTASQYAAVLGGVEGVSLQLAKYEKANAGRESAFNAMEGAKALWTELTGQGFTEDGAPVVSPEEAAANGTPDATAAEQVGKGEAGEDFGTFLQQFARERGYSEEEIAKTVADINAAGGSAAYIKSQKEQNPAYFHEDVAAAIAAKPSDLWIEDEDGKIVQNPDVNVNEAREAWQLGVLDALRKIDPAYTVEDAKEAIQLAETNEAAKEFGPGRTQDELKVALEKGEIDQATFDAEMAKMSGSAEPGEVVEGILDDKITTTVLPDEATENLIKGANEAIDASETPQRTSPYEDDWTEEESKKVTRELYEQGDVKTLEKLVGFGDPNAQYQLGRIYDNGKGVPQDDAEAVRLYRLAAEQGNAEAQNYLKKLEESGSDLESQVDEDRATVELGKAEKRLATMPVTKRLIERVESKPGLEGYKTLWANWEQPGGRYEGTDITTMSLGQLFKFADDGYHNANNLNSAPFGKFQFLDSTLKDLINRMPGITEGTVFTPENQLAMFTWYAKDRLGNRQGDAAVSKLIAIWEGLGKGDVAYDDILQMASEIRGTTTEPPVPVKYTLPADTEGAVGVGGITVAVNSISRKNQRGENFNAPPIFGTSGEHSHTPSPKNKPYAEGNMQKLMAKNGPFHRVQAKMNNLFPNMGPVRINDALVHAGSTRESVRPPTRTKSGSQHFHGTALDVSIAGMSKDQKIALWEAAYEEGFRGFGFGTNILHMDMGNARIWGYGNIAKKEVWEGISFKDLKQGIVSAGPRGGDNFIVGARATFEGDTGDRAVEDKEGKQGDVDVISLGDYVLPQGIFGIPGMTAKSPEEIFFEEGEYVPQALADDFGDPSAEDSDEEVPFMRRPSEERLAGPDDELKDLAWRKLEEGEIEELVEISQGDSGLKDNASMSLAQRYQTGRGVPKDLGKARDYYEAVVMEGGELADDAATALEAFTSSESLQLQREEGRGTMIKGEPYILLPGGMVVRGRDGEAANEAITTLVKRRLRVEPE